MITIYYNPKCSKCRQTLAILEEKGLEYEKIEYIKTPPSVSELKEIVVKLGGNVRQIIRKKEEVYLRFKGDSDEAWYQILHDNPKLIERPIVINGDRAVISRPAEKVLEII